MNYPNAYKNDERDIQFLLWEQFDLESEILPACGIDRSEVNAILTSAGKFAREKLGVHYQSADREGCRLKANNRVVLPESFPGLWQDYRESGWNELMLNEEDDDGHIPFVVVHAILEMFCGANPSFMMYMGFGVPVARLIELFGSPWLNRIFHRRLLTSEWSACFCVTEPQAGSDVGAVRTRATRQDDGTYLVEGEKIFITAGMHDLSENMVYLVIARTPDAPPGTTGLSCFLVPRFTIDEAGEITGDNHVTCTRLEDKMGLRACATAALSFGHTGPCVGYLLGERENAGLRQLLSLMNLARISTGIFGLSMASSAYLNAAHYASTRLQGTELRQSFNPKAQKVAIINHLDVRRMLLEMKSRVEGCRALVTKLSYHYSCARLMEAGRLPDDSEALRRHEGLANLLTPVVKAYVSDQAWRISEIAIQVYGGHGYIRDYPLEQYARDCKILSIWEGTNFIQSADLLRDKLAMGRDSKLFRLYLDDIGGFLAEVPDAFAAERDALARALDALTTTHAMFGGWVRERDMDLVFATSTRFLEMMAETTLAWLLLEGAVIAQARLEGQPGASDQAFYRGKVVSMRYFFRNILPGVSAKATILSARDESVREADASVFLYDEAE
ncbi:acyl-CoA dehydrogenase [Marinobacter sp.]|uniref:acyl-CoA dehydrogenase n=1 Tax=Marinobacter sp. TaxID=50741 RepID=UPI00384FB1C1